MKQICYRQSVDDENDRYYLSCIEDSTFHSLSTDRQGLVPEDLFVLASGYSEYSSSRLVRALRAFTLYRSIATAFSSALMSALSFQGNASNVYRSVKLLRESPHCDTMVVRTSINGFQAQVQLP